MKMASPCPTSRKTTQSSVLSQTDLPQFKSPDNKSGHHTNATIMSNATNDTALRFSTNSLIKVL